MSKMRSIAPVVNFDGAVGVTTRTRRMLRRRFRRWLDALIESRMQKAEEQTKQDLKLLPEDVLHRAGYRIARKDAGGSRPIADRKDRSSA